MGAAGPAKGARWQGGLPGFVRSVGPDYALASEPTFSVIHVLLAILKVGQGPPYFGPTNRAYWCRGLRPSSGISTFAGMLRKIWFANVSYAIEREWFRQPVVSTQELQKLVGGHPCLTDDRAQGPDRKALPGGDNYQTGRITLENHRPVAALAATRRVFKSRFSESRNDLSRRKRWNSRRHTATRKDVVQRCSEVRPSSAESSVSSSRAFST